MRPGAASVRLRIAAYALGVLVSGAVLAWTVVGTYRGHEETVAVLALQRLVLERTLLQDEFLLHGEDRARAQWREHTTRVRALLPRIRRAAGGSAEVLRSLAALEEELRRTEALFGKLEAPSPPAVRPALEPRAASRERTADDLILASFQIYSEASRLAELAVEHERGRQRAALGVVGLVVLAAMGVVIGVTAVLAGRTAGRIARLEEGARRIAAGDLAHRIRLPGQDDLAALGRAFDEMAERLGAGIRQLEASNRELEAFSYSVSHDLRTPLRHISGFVDLLVEEASGRLDPQGLRYLGVIRQAAQDMGRLIDDLLAFSRIGRQALSPRPVEVQPIVEELVAELMRSQRHAPEVAWDIAPLPPALADPAMLRLVFTNLLDNALKFTRDRPVAHVAVGAREDGDATEYFVKDDGVGFDMQYAGKLFGVFQRLHRQDEFEGTGVGLANVQRIVHRHGGSIRAEARVGGGATFWFSLPRAPAAGS